MPAGGDPSGSDSRVQRLATRLLRAVVLSLGVLAIAVALFTLAARAGLPFVAGYKSDIEIALGDTLGRPVSIEALSLAWRGSGPVLDATGLGVGDADGRRITLDAALIDLHAFASLWRRKPVLNEITLVGADLQLVRERDGRYTLQGLGESVPSATPPLPRAGRDPLQAFGWLFDAARVELVDSRLTLVERGGDRHLSFDALSIRAHNDARLHRLRIGVDLPGTLGERVELDVDLQPLAGSATLGTLAGDWNLRVDRLALAPVLELLVGLDLVPAAVGSFGADADLSTELWGRLEGGLPSSGHGQLVFDTFRVGAGRRSDTLPDALRVPFTARRDAAGDWRVAADGAEIVRGEQRLRVERLRVHGRAGSDPGATASPGSWRLEAGGPPAGAGRPGAPLELITGLGASLPASLAPAALDWLDTAAPRGELEGWRVVLDTAGSSAAAWPALTLDADIVRLSLLSAGGVPGVDALDIALQVADGVGQVGVRPAAIGSGQARQTSITAPASRSDPLVLSALDVDLTVERIATAGWRASGPVALASGTFEADARVSVTVDDRSSPLLDVQGRFALGDAGQMASLLPDRLLGAAATDWFRDAFRAGAASEGQVLLFGRLADFPFERGDGVFRADARIDGLDLAWLDDWPAARQLEGRVSVSGAAISARAVGGRIGDMAIDAATLSIDDLRAPWLVLDATGVAETGPMLAFATGGPLSSLLEPALGDASGEGPVTMDLRVEAPLSGAAFERRGPLQVDGTLFFSGNRLRFARADIELAALTGGVSFDQDGARMHRVRADWLGRPVRLDAVTDGRGEQRAMTLVMDGVLAADEVVAHFGLPLERWLTGASRWSTTLTVPFDAARMTREGATLVATSDLVGTALSLPAPLGKGAAEPIEFEVATAFLPDEPVVRWRVSQRGGRLPDVEALADVAGEELLSLAIGLGARAADATGRPGVRLDGAIETMDADGWIEALATLIEDIGSSGAAGASQASGSPGSSGPETAILPVSGELQVDQLSLRSAPLGMARLRLDSDPRYLNAALDNRWLNGTVRYPRRRVGPDGQLMALKARLERVDGRVVDALLGASEELAEPAADEPVGGPDPRALPPIEARIGSLGWDRLVLDGITLRTEPTPTGLDVSAIGFTHRNLQVFGEGRWELLDPQRYDAEGDGAHRTELALTVQSSDFEAGLAGIGLTGLLGGTAGRATATLGWPGPLWSPDVSRLHGDLEMALERGRVVPLEPGAGRLIGLFALQTLPRRLSLDFSDLVDDGLAFTTLDGRATLERGVLDTSLLQLTGPVGVIDVSGTTDLVTQTLDQRITVLPRVSAALPIIGAISGGATAGIGVLVAGGLLKALGVDFDRIGLREYTLDGPWSEPRLTPVPTAR